MNDFPYYPEPLNNQQNEKTVHTQNSDNQIVDMLKKVENINSENLISTILSSGLFGQNQNPLVVQALTNLLTKNNSQTKKEEASSTPSFEDL